MSFIGSNGCEIPPGEEDHAQLVFDLARKSTHGFDSYARQVGRLFADGRPVHGERMQWNNTASVAVRPQPHLAAGQLSPADLAVVSDWIRVNEAVLVDYWEQRIFTDELLAGLLKLP